MWSVMLSCTINLVLSTESTKYSKLNHVRKLNFVRLQWLHHHFLVLSKHLIATLPTDLGCSHLKVGAKTHIMHSQSTSLTWVKFFRDSAALAFHKPNGSTDRNIVRQGRLSKNEKPLLFMLCPLAVVFPNTVYTYFLEAKTANQNKWI